MIATTNALGTASVTLTLPTFKGILALRLRIIFRATEQFIDFCRERQ